MLVVLQLLSRLRAGALLDASNLRVWLPRFAKCEILLYPLSRYDILCDGSWKMLPEFQILGLGTGK